jgi:hypothetical protein
MASAVIDGIATHYEVIGSGPPLLLYAPGGFNATVEGWSTRKTRRSATACAARCSTATRHRAASRNS